MYVEINLQDEDQDFEFQDRYRDHSLKIASRAEDSSFHDLQAWQLVNVCSIVAFARSSRCDLQFSFSAPVFSDAVIRARESLFAEKANGGENGGEWKKHSRKLTARNFFVCFTSYAVPARVSKSRS